MFSCFREHNNHYHHHAICLTSPQPLPKLILQRVICSACSSNFQYLLVSLISPSSRLRLLPRLPVPSTFSSCFRRQFLPKMSPIHLPFLIFTVLLYFMQSFISHMIYPTYLFHPSTASHFKTFKELLMYVFEICKET